MGKAYERLHFLQRTWVELNRLNEVYGSNYSNACINCMKQIVKFLKREIKLHEKEKAAAKKKAKKLTPKEENHQSESRQKKNPQ